MECGNGYRIVVWENHYDERNEVIDFGDDYLWGKWDGARITVEYGNELLAYDVEGDCRFLGGDMRGFYWIKSEGSRCGC